MLPNFLIWLFIFLVDKMSFLVQNMAKSQFYYHRNMGKQGFIKIDNLYYLYLFIYVINIKLYILIYFKYNMKKREVIVL